MNTMIRVTIKNLSTEILHSKVAFNAIVFLKIYEKKTKEKIACDGRFNFCLALTKLDERQKFKSHGDKR